MNQNIYPLANAPQVPMLGRRKVLDAVLSRIGKATGDHISMVGAPYIGKTTFLHHLSSVVGPERGGYVAAAFLDLRHHTPQTDHEFRQRLLEEIHAALKHANDESGELIDLSASEEDLPQVLSGVFDYLADTGRLLVIMDGLDHVLSSPTISRNLWDYLREIGLKSSCTFVTGTRRRILDLCNNPDSVASEFWNIFADPVVVLKPFDEDEQDQVLAPLSDHLEELATSARKEIFNWSGGHPALVALLCRGLVEVAGHGSKIDGKAVNDKAETIADGDYDLLQHLWDDCPIEVRGDIHALAAKEPASDSIPSERASFAAQRGFLTPGKKPKLSCRFMEKMALHHGSEAVELKRLFLTEDLYAKQIQRVLELRLAQVPGGDSKLRGYVERATRELSTGPAETLNSIRLISRRALELIWNAELDGGTWPQSWIDIWKGEGNDGLRLIEKTQRAFPKQDGMQCAILREITGGYGNLPTIAKHVTRSSYILVEHVKSAGDLGQHLEDKLTTADAASICFACVELFARLAKKLPGLGSGVATQGS